MKRPVVISEDYLKKRALYQIGKTEMSEAKLKSFLTKAVQNKLQKASMAEARENDLEAPGYRSLNQETRELIDKVVALMVEKNFVNDERYAESKTRSLRNRGVSKRKIEMKMKEAGVTVDTEIMEGFSEEDELNAAIRFCQKKRLGYYGKPDTDPRKELAKLGAAGFSFHTAQKALRYNPDEDQLI